MTHELGSKFTWHNPDQPNQKGWALDKETRQKIADGTYKQFVIALDAGILQTDGGMGGIEVSINSLKNGFCMDFNAFPWNWNSETEKGGYIGYIDLLAGGYATRESQSDVISLIYDLTSHPNYADFKAEMSSAEWGEVSIQYGIGIRYLPFVNAYLQG